MTRPAALLLALATLVVTGCGGDDAGEQDVTRNEGLGAALEAVAAGPASEQRFGWTDVTAVRELTGTGDPGSDDFRRWSGALAAGAPELVLSFALLDDELDLDVLGADRAIAIGVAPDRAERLDGIDPVPVAEALREQGAEEDQASGVAVLRLSPDGFDPADPLARVALTLGEAVVAEDQTAVFAGSDAAALEVLGTGDETLADRPDHAAGADCLGDVVSAELLADEDLTSAVALVAIGVRAGDEPAEVLCAVGDDGQAEAAAESLRERLNPEATSLVTGAPLSEAIEAVEVETGESGGRAYARAVVTPHDDAPLEFLQQSLAQNQLELWLGG